MDVRTQLSDLSAEARAALAHRIKAHLSVAEEQSDHDVAIVGGGLAALTLALELRSARPGYGQVPLKRASIKPELVALPPEGTILAETEKVLKGNDHDAWVNWESSMVRTPAELADVGEHAGASPVQ